jgi:hypothetical protein
MAKAVTDDLPVSCQIEELTRYLQHRFATLKKCQNFSVLTRFRKHNYSFPKQIYRYALLIDIRGIVFEQLSS